MDKSEPIAECDQCGKKIYDIADVGYMGPADRGSTECNPFVEQETKCAECEGSSVTDKE